jgi:hypothetical protein
MTLIAYAECDYAECRYAECHYVECLGTDLGYTSAECSLFR